ncbi:MAG: periplasmic heavy metal sensor [bacterium]
MKNWLIASGVAASLALAAVVCAGQEHHGDGPGLGGGAGGPGGGRGGGLQAILDNEEIVKKLGITDAQVKAVREAGYERQKVMISLRADAELAQLDVKKLMDQDTPDTEAVMKALDTVGRLETEIRKEGVRNQLRIREIIGTDTARKLRDIMRERKGREGGDRQGKRGPGQGKGRGPGPQGGPGMDEGMPLEDQ